MAKTVLIIEDDHTQRVILEAFLRTSMNLDSYMAENGRKGLEILATKPSISLVISDIQMPVMDGIEALKEIKKAYPAIPVIMVSAAQDLDQAVTAIKLGAADYINKPYDKSRMTVTIQNVMKMQTMGQEIERLQHDKDNRFTFTDMIGHDDGLKNVIQLAKKAAMVDLPTLINGETGTGKELFAKAIHGESKQSGAPFIAVNCGAIPADLVESTLFGHEKGAFTGATQSAIGKFREAEGGTIFLDEVGDLPLEAQVKLLRVLQEREVEPVGASRSVKINVRIVTATHRNLEEDVHQGLFREDLYYRLNVLQMKIPSLKSRPQDIPSLIDYFMRNIAITANIPEKTIEPKTLSVLQKRKWPGNVRELENSVYRACVLSNNSELQINDFPLQKQFTKDVDENTNHKELHTEHAPYETIAEMEIAMIKDALSRHDGNMTKAAQHLGLAKSTLYRKVREHKNT
ncbi:MAG: sigma-54-dependent Fis family transcriptional regulator [Alphaproteobacteria bacterium]|nr:MAG: sigma-54-dependent Fis family transcriptional regulator [Alphaproteobacteria bacterium]